MFTLSAFCALLVSTAWSAPAPCPPTYHLAFSTNRNTSAPVYHAAKLIQSPDPTTFYIIAGLPISPTSPISSGAQATFNNTGSRQCLALSYSSIKDAGLSIGTPRIDPSGPAFSYPVSASPNYKGDCRWYLGSDPSEVSVFPGIYEANEGLYSCKTLVGDVLYDVLSLGKTSGSLESPKDCVNTVATAFRV